MAFLAVVLISGGMGIYLISRPEVLEMIGIEIWAGEDIEVF